MKFSKTTPEILTEKISMLLGAKVKYPDIPTDGAKKAAELISGLLKPVDKSVNQNSLN